jgi:hypothetical protein
MWAIVLRPIVAPIAFVLLVAPIAWSLYRVFPESRLKVVLFRVRTGPHATRRDKWVMVTAGTVAYAAFLGWVVFLAGR